VEVNLLGTIYVARTFLPHFRARGRGHLIMMASMGAIAPMPNETIYCATKFGVRGFGLALALELHDTPIRVTVMCPDSVRTPQLRREALENGSPLAFASRLLTAETVARAIRDAILQPRREVLVPAFRGVLIRLLNLFPSGLSAALPVLDRIGRRRRARYVAELGREQGAAV
jgi:short-subunit dehydrogenase